MTAKVSYDAEGRVQTSELFDANRSDREGTVGVVEYLPPLRHGFGYLPRDGWHMREEGQSVQQ